MTSIDKTFYAFCIISKVNFSSLIWKSKTRKRRKARKARKAKIELSAVSAFSNRPYRYTATASPNVCSLIRIPENVETMTSSIQEVHRADESRRMIGYLCQKKHAQWISIFFSQLNWDLKQHQLPAGRLSFCHHPWVPQLYFILAPVPSAVRDTTRYITRLPPYHEDQLPSPRLCHVLWQTQKNIWTLSKFT